MINYTCEYCKCETTNNGGQANHCYNHPVKVTFNGIAYTVNAFDGSKDLIIHLKMYEATVDCEKWNMYFMYSISCFRLSYKKSNEDFFTNVLEFNYIPDISPEQAIAKCRTMITFS